MKTMGSQSGKKIKVETLMSKTKKQDVSKKKAAKGRYDTP